MAGARGNSPRQRPRQARVDEGAAECIMRLPGATTTMSMTPAKIEAFERASLRSDLPEFKVGDTVAVHYKIVEGDKLRVQVFRGIVIKRHRGGARSTFTVSAPAALSAAANECGIGSPPSTMLIG